MARSNALLQKLRGHTINHLLRDAHHSPNTITKHLISEELKTHRQPVGSAQPLTASQNNLVRKAEDNAESEFISVLGWQSKRICLLKQCAAFYFPTNHNLPGHKPKVSGCPWKEIVS